MSEGELPFGASIGIVGAVATAMILGGYVFNLGPEFDVPHARSMAMAALITASGAMTAGLTGLGSRPAVVASVPSVASAFAAIRVQPVASVLHLSPLHPIDWAIAVLGAVVISAGTTFLRREGAGRDATKREVQLLDVRATTAGGSYPSTT